MTAQAAKHEIQKRYMIMEIFDSYAKTHNIVDVNDTADRECEYGKKVRDVQEKLIFGIFGPLLSTAATLGFKQLKGTPGDIVPPAVSGLISATSSVIQTIVETEKLKAEAKARQQKDPQATEPEKLQLPYTENRDGFCTRVGEFEADFRGPGQSDNMQSYFQLPGLN
ncbi:hypothetical protein G7Y89_g3211 [Cudoniella acicularis]|uniref:Uncharacterized protein n=1 Tax=Cudoniella acicularis TaxID=354080 RepID=A0A8H4W7W1_9HELO|nr:hypothetical protein G7Y89_g3211 [Cudoniella acicularis]